MSMSDDNLYELYATSPYIQGDVGEVVTASELRSRCGMEVLRNIYLPFLHSDYIKQDEALGIDFDYTCRFVYYF